MGNCIFCEQKVSPYSPAPDVCWDCQEKVKDVQKPLKDGQLYDVADLMNRYGYKNREQVLRKMRRGELPPAVPSIKEPHWRKDVIDEWEKGNILTTGEAEQIKQQAAEHDNVLRALRQSNGDLEIDPVTGNWRWKKPQEAGSILGAAQVKFTVTKG